LLTTTITTITIITATTIITITTTTIIITIITTERSVRSSVGGRRGPVRSRTFVTPAKAAGRWSMVSRIVHFLAGDEERALRPARERHKRTSATADERVQR
jgi:hypothetical protein